MTDRDDINVPGERNWRAGEFALGLLDGDELVQAAEDMRRDPAFASEVAAWRMRFAGFDDEFAEETVPSGLHAAVNRELFGPPPSLAQRLWTSTPFWRGATAAGVAAAAVFAVIGLTSAPPAGPVSTSDMQLITALVSELEELSVITRYDAQNAVLHVNRIAGEAPEGGDLELWFAPTADGAPTSLGVMPTDTQSFQVPLSPDLAEQISTEGHFGISQEPAGGSPTGAPTGPVIAVADIYEI
ncbi:anti-sigma factor domain-containing protein [Roseobacter sp. HKCCA0434]|uniref:anti-sigma factor n=1 Tax=Roseobacter sp. HKCCA0434 TaxID=3079297 RepID=UPI002905D8AF|nr:anti-sigma factor [Roseobacter sp. HKCCA0434]